MDSHVGRSQLRIDCWADKPVCGEILAQHLDALQLGRVAP